MGLAFVLAQEPDFVHCAVARWRECPVCYRHARYCGHTRDQMIAALLPRKKCATCEGVGTVIRSNDMAIIGCPFCTSAQPPHIEDTT
jgi:uncharacterized protein YggL (DUF469 family)